MATRITDTQIEQLRDVALAAGDVDQVMVCEVALHGYGYVVEEYSVAGDVPRRLRSQAAARHELVVYV
jgi:hypothetical protein